MTSTASAILRLFDDDDDDDNDDDDDDDDDDSVSRFTLRTIMSINRSINILTANTNSVKIIIMMTMMMMMIV